MTGPGDGRMAGYKLIESGRLVDFDILDTKVEDSAGGDEAIVTIELQLAGDEEMGESDAEWGAFGFIFAVAVLSFHDARPRDYTEDYVEQDEFNVVDLFDCLRYERGELRFSADYIRSRCVKTDVTVRPDGKVTVSTRARGTAASHWVNRLKGKKQLQSVE